jgi:hypothetical protein
MAEPECEQSSPLELANSENGDQLFFGPDVAIFKQRMLALCCGPDKRTCADVLGRIHTNKLSRSASVVGLCREKIEVKHAHCRVFGHFEHPQTKATPITQRPASLCHTYTKCSKC